MSKTEKEARNKAARYAALWGAEGARWAIEGRDPEECRRLYAMRESAIGKVLSAAKERTLTARGCAELFGVNEGAWRLWAMTGRTPAAEIINDSPVWALSSLVAFAHGGFKVGRVTNNVLAKRYSLAAMKEEFAI